MKSFTVALTLCAMLFVSAVAFAGNIHKDGNGAAMQVFTPLRNTTVTQTKADVTYTPTAGTKVVRVQPNAAVTYKINGTGAAYPIASGANEGPFGIGTRIGAGVKVSTIVFGGASSATKTIYIQEQ